MLSDVMEDYLKSIYHLTENGGRVSTSALAEYLGVSPSTVTSMLGKLEERGLADYEKYEGATLTAEGETVALEVLRHHRLIESYLAEQLDYDWSEVHDEADRLEHHISEEFERAIADSLEDPEVDPHGDPIPGADLAPIEESETTRLADHDEGDVVVVERVRDRDGEELEYLSKAGITPGTRLEVEEVAPFGMLTVRLESGIQSLPERVATAIRVRDVAEEAGDGEETGGHGDA
jgi:DtxR family Mn-dependent transcriptional regulator